MRIIAMFMILMHHFIVHNGYDVLKLPLGPERIFFQLVMAGGGSLIYGFDQLVEKDTGIRTTVVDDALSCAAFGSGKMLMNLNDMQDGMVNLARKRQMKA